MTQPDDNLAGRIRGLKVAFAGRPALAGVDLDLPRGRLTVVLGRSGSGKTTLLRSLNRLNECLPDCRTQGLVQLRLGGTWRDIHQDEAPVEDLRRRVGMVFQTPALLPLSVAKNLTLPLRLTLGLGKAEALEAGQRALVKAQRWDEVKDRLRQPAVGLSGGQQQRLCLARALALGPEILLLDEPTASLDYQATAKIEELLLSLAGEYTLVVVSHGLGQARRLAHQVAVLRQGLCSRVLEGIGLRDGRLLEELLDEAF
ncbi:MAG: ATP-binding cassette domain-containing protein [Desulfarculus sp.]|nr:ATP-binding cassette domain-containing protein [Desulfarculus sp.]